MMEAVGEPECLHVACSAERGKVTSDRKTAPRPRGAQRVDEACCNGQQLLERQLPRPDCLSRMS